MRKIFVATGVILIFVSVALRLLDPAAMQTLRLAFFDQMQIMQPRATQNFPVRIVDIDEDSLDALGQWPWPRTTLAEMVEKLGEAGAAVIVFDILFAEPDRMSPHRLLSDPAFAPLLAGRPQSDLPDHDAILARAIAAQPVVLGIASSLQNSGDPVLPKSGIVEIGNSPHRALVSTAGLTRPLAVLADQAQGLGMISMSPYDTSERVRRVPLLWRGPDGQIIPALALDALRIAFGQSSYILRGEDSVLGAANAGGQAIIQSVRIGPVTVPTTEDGSLWVRYRPDHPDLYVSAARLMSATPDQIRQDFEGRIVMVGASAAGLLDIRTTALGETVPGVSIHAQIVEQILQGDFLYRTDSISGFEILAFGLLCGLVLWIMSAAGAVVSILAGGVGAGAILLTSWYLFTFQGVLFDITFPVLGGGLFFAMMTAFQFFVADRDKKMIRRSFAHYVAPEVLDQIEQSGHRIRLGGEMRSVAVMFCDIRNFTALSETMAAPQMVSVLNEIFTTLSAEILRQKGTIDKYIGDSIMAFWNAPVDVADYAARSCKAALAMRLALQMLNRTLDPKSREDVGIAIGIGLGTACIGNVGSRMRFNYSAIGDVVNRAARIEASCRDVAYDILVSEDVQQAAPDLAYLGAGRLTLKGVSQRQRIFALVGDASLAADPGFQDLAAAHEALLMTCAETGDLPVAALAECAERARMVDPALAAFYTRLAARPLDFKE